MLCDNLVIRPLWKGTAGQGTHGRLTSKAAEERSWNSVFKTWDFAI